MRRCFRIDIKIPFAIHGFAFSFFVYENAVSMMHVHLLFARQVLQTCQKAS